MLKKMTTVSLSVLVTAGIIAAGCGDKKEGSSASPAASSAATTAASASPSPAAGGYVPKELKVQFVPSQAAETLQAKAKPLEKLLGDKLGISVSVTVSTNYNVIVEAMASKQVDVGFLPPNGYVVAHDTKKAADLLLQAQRYAIDDATGKEVPGKLVDFYKAQFVVKKDSPIKAFADLKGKKVAWQDVTSSAGYIYPSLELKKAGIDAEKDVTGTIVKGHDKGVLAVLNGEVDAAATFQDARNNVIKDVPDVFEKTRVILTTAEIPNDTISVRSDMDPAFREKLAQAFIDIGKDPEGSKIIYDVYSHRGYVKSDDSKFNVVRDANKALEGKK
ncbi:phosphate/phosphite/phosphonate ABC transporter substrate-binding protein [Gorillibacterium sp. sgz5001074]|uniref:phosphate/phosphite/phosphonate ABC transporter substrate-binding protein n=1 Tax=Gorillibacterium sp. sgz5001074 TaxID=3446695 RepID=UPI003F67C9DE